MQPAPSPDASAICEQEEALLAQQEAHLLDIGAAVNRDIMRCVLINSFCHAHPKDAAILAAAWLEDHGAGFPEFSWQSPSLRSDADYWADIASPPELEAYAAAALRRIERVAFAPSARKRLLVMFWQSLPDSDRRAFLAQVDPDGVFRGRGK